MPKIKHYVILSADDRFWIPVKALTNPYNDRPAYAGGNPALFGGTQEAGDDALATLGKELAEESRGTLGLAQGAQLTLVHQETVGNNEMHFYSTPNWEGNTQPPWPNPVNAAQMEMDWLAWIPMDAFHAGMSDAEIRGTLVERAQASGGSENQALEFAASGTLKALITYVRNRLAN